MNCHLCDRESMLMTVPINGKMYPCCRWIYKNENCYAVLKPEQHTTGDTIVVLNNHKNDISSEIHSVELYEFIKAINLVSKKLMKITCDERKEKPERIYVGILCDGTQHLHAHLIPRYPFSEADKAEYRRLFLARDGDEEINRKIVSNDLGGYWYITDKEKFLHKSNFSKKSPQDRVTIIENLAKVLRAFDPN